MSDLLKLPPRTPVFRFFYRVEEWIGVLSLFVLLALPITDFVARHFFKQPLPGTLITTRHLMLYIAFFGGMLAARERQHLAIETFLQFAGPRLRGALALVTSFFATAFATAFTWGALSLFLTGFTPGAKVGFLPIQVFAVALPIGLGFITVRCVTKAPLDRTAKFVASGRLSTSPRRCLARPTGPRRSCPR